VVRFRRLYGESPLHLLALIASLLIAGAAIAGWFASFTGPTIVNVLVWFLGAIVAHDLFLVPLYSALDRIAFGRRLGRRPPAPAARPSGVPYVRIPAMLSALVFLVFFPEILRLGDHAFFSASGFHQRVYLVRYLLTCSALFALSALAYALTLRRARRPGAGARRSQPRTRPSLRRTLRALRTRARAWPARRRRTHGARHRAGTRR